MSIMKNAVLLIIFSILVLFSTIMTTAPRSSFLYTDSVAYSQQNNDNENHRVAYKGVNVLGYYTSIPESRENNKQIIPPDYYDETFKTISKAGMNLVRYLFTWESYENSPSLFIKELSQVARSADRWGINVIYANDQFRISSWLDQESGYGFPSFLFKHNNFPLGGGGSPNNATAQQWWTSLYNRSILIADTNGPIDGWSLQADFLKKIVKVVDHHKSTLGYEILNEPHVYSIDQWEKIGNYNTFVANELRELN